MPAVPAVHPILTASANSSSWLVPTAALAAWLAWRAWQWHRLLARWAQHPGARLLTISSVYQRARTGTKAIVTWPNGDRQDAWFAGRRVHTGSHLLLFGGTGYGPHNREPRVLYVDRIIASAGMTGPFAFGAARFAARALRVSAAGVAATTARLRPAGRRSCAGASRLPSATESSARGWFRRRC